MIDFLIALVLLLGTGAAGVVAFMMFVCAVAKREQRSTRKRRSF